MKRFLWFFLSKTITALDILQRELHRLVQNLTIAKLIYHDFVPRPSDIFIVTYPRSGTTWMQMILYQLTTSGDMDFEHISQKCPFFEVNFRSQGNFNQFSSPRLFKTHLSSIWFPRRSPCRYIHVIRDGRDVAVSSFNFRKSHFGFKDDFSVFFKKHFMKKNNPEILSWFQHTSGWLNRQKDHNVLYLSYEDLKTDLKGCLYKIADFCGLEIDPDRLPAILHRCSFSFMKQYEEKFDPATESVLASQVQQGAFIRKGSSGGWSEHFSPEQLEIFDRRFRKYLGQKFSSVQNLSKPERRSDGVGKEEEPYMQRL